MPRPCYVCKHPKREAMELASMEGTTNEAIAEELGISESSVQRHMRNHQGNEAVTALVIKGNAQEIIDQGLGTGSQAIIYKRLVELVATVEHVRDEAVKSNKPTVILAATKEEREILSLINKFTTKLDGQSDELAEYKSLLRDLMLELRTVLVGHTDIAKRLIAGMKMRGRLDFAEDLENGLRILGDN